MSTAAGTDVQDLVDAASKKGPRKEQRYVSKWARVKERVEDDAQGIAVCAKVARALGAPVSTRQTEANVLGRLESRLGWGG